MRRVAVSGIVVLALLGVGLFLGLSNTNQAAVPRHPNNLRIHLLSSSSSPPSGVPLSVDTSSDGSTAAVEIGKASLTTSGSQVSASVNADIEVVNLQGQQVSSTYSVSGGPVGQVNLSADGSQLWLTSPPTDTIIGINSSTHALSSHLTPAAGSVTPGSASALDPQDGSIWVSNPQTGQVSDLSLSTGDLIKRFSVFPGTILATRGMGLAFGPGGELWVSDIAKGQLVAVNTSDGNVSATISIPGILNDGLAVSGSDAWVVVAENGGQAILPVDLQTQNVGSPIASFVKTIIRLPSRVEGQTLWVVDVAKGVLEPINVTTGAIGPAVPVATAEATTPTGTAPAQPSESVINCYLASPALAQAARSFSGVDSPSSVGRVPGKEWCGRYSNSDTWIWVVSGSPSPNKSGFIATFTCASGDANCLNLASVLPLSGWTIHAPPDPGLVGVISPAGLMPSGQEGVALAVSSFTSGSTAVYYFDPLSLTFVDRTGALAASPAPVPATS